MKFFQEKSEEYVTKSSNSSLYENITGIDERNNDNITQNEEDKKNIALNITINIIKNKTNFFFKTK